MVTFSKKTIINLIAKELEYETTRSLAKKIGISAATVSRLSRGICAINIETLLRVVDYFDIEITDVFPSQPAL